MISAISAVANLNHQLPRRHAPVLNRRKETSAALDAANPLVQTGSVVTLSAAAYACLLAEQAL